MFSIGDIVVYRHHVCKIAKVRENYFDNEDYFELHTLFENTLKLYIAISKAEPPACRSVMTKEQALALIDKIPFAEPIDEKALAKNAGTSALVERRIKEEYDRRLKSADLEDMLPILKSVHEHCIKREEMGRKITMTDKKYFDTVERMLCDELAVALDIGRDEIKDYLANRVQEIKNNTL